MWLSSCMCTISDKSTLSIPVHLLISLPVHLLLLYRVHALNVYVRHEIEGPDEKHKQLEHTAINNNTTILHLLPLPPKQNTIDDKYLVQSCRFWTNTAQFLHAIKTGAQRRFIQIWRWLQRGEKVLLAHHRTINRLCEHLAIWRLRNSSRVRVLSTEKCSSDLMNPSCLLFLCCSYLRRLI